MNINQFAKISPIIDSDGYLYNLNQDGTIVSDSVTNVRLKANEIGIIYKEDVLATMYNDKLIRLGVAVYDNESLNSLLSNNDGSLDGKLIVLTNEGHYYLGIISGKSVKCPEFNVVHAAVFTVTDDGKSATYTDSYIGSLPYKILRITVKINKNIMTEGSRYGGVINIKSGNDTITTVDYRDIEYSDGKIVHELLECQNIFKDANGVISINTDTSTTNKNIQVCVEYMVKGDNLYTITEVNNNG